MRTSGLSWLVPLLAALGAGPADGSPAQGGRDRSEFDELVPRLSGAEEQLAHARSLKVLLRERPPETRAFWRERVVAAYQAVRELHPRARAAGAEGAFRAGELLRAAGAEEGALEEFRAARELGAGTPFRARAGLEIGHVHRRAGRRELALDAYVEVASDPRAATSHHDDAWLWSGTLWRDAGRHEEARRAWRRVAEGGVDPLDRIRAYDFLGLLWIERDDLEAAAGVLDECLRALADDAVEETSAGARVRRGLERMRIVEELPLRIARRRVLKRSGGEDREKLDKMERLFHRMH